MYAVPHYVTGQKASSLTVLSNSSFEIQIMESETENCIQMISELAWSLLKHVDKVKLYGRNMISNNKVCLFSTSAGVLTLFTSACYLWSSRQRAPLHLGDRQQFLTQVTTATAMYVCHCFKKKNPFWPVKLNRCSTWQCVRMCRPSHTPACSRNRACRFSIRSSAGPH